MLKLPLTYTDFDGVERTEDHYFNFTKQELMEMAVSEEGGLDKFIIQMVNEKDLKRYMELIKKFILMSYGVKSPDGRRFVKNQEIRDAFQATQAFSDLYVKLLDPEEAGKFINAVMPKDLVMAAEKDMNQKINVSDNGYISLVDATNK